VQAVRAVRALRPYAIYFLAWTLVGLIYFGQDVTRRLYLNDPRPWQEAEYWAVRVYLSAALTPLLLRLGRTWPFERRVWLRRTAQHLLFSAGFAFVETALETAVLAQLGAPASLSLAGAFRRWFPFLLISGFHSAVIAYWVVLGIQSGFRYYRQFHERAQEALRLELHASELKAQLAHAQLSALKMQLQPHFLFNTLNAIVVLVRQQKGQEAEETLARFSDLLRAVLSDMDAEEVPLSRELEYLRLYLSIEQLRFSDRLRVDVSADPDILDAAVPHMGLQPIVENAVRHGIGRRAAASSIDIQAARVSDTLRITVRDDGPGFPSASASGGRGIGLANTRARLKQLYGDAAMLQIASGDCGGAIVTMILPYRIHPSLTDDVHLVGGSRHADTIEQRSLEHTRGGR
jgi:two-component system LytT family sensor kinase